MNKPEPKPFRTEGPQPLLRSIPPGLPYPAAALGPLRAGVEAVQEMTQAPLALAAQSALAVAALAVQPFANVETLGGDAPLSLYCLTIAQSGERKSACDKRVLAGLRRHERELVAEHREAMVGWKRRHRVWTAKRDRFAKEAASASSETALAAEADLAALGPEPAPPLVPQIIATEPTFEGLAKLFIHGQPSLGLFSDEGGAFLGGHAMNAENRLRTLAGLSDLWGGAALNRTRAGDGTVTLYGRRLSLHLMMQGVAARPLLADPVANGQGFLARLLITEPQSAIGTRLRVGNSDVAEVAEVALANRLCAILRTPKPASETDPQELQPRILRLSAGAKDVLWKYYVEVETAQAPWGNLDQMTAFASKAPEQAARIAGVLALWADLEACEVTAETMRDGVALAEFYLSEAKRLSEAAVISEETAKAERLRLWLLKDWPRRAATQGRDPDTILARDVVNCGPGALRETKLVLRLLAILEEFGWIVALPTGTEIDGAARSAAWRIVRG